MRSNRYEQARTKVQPEALQIKSLSKLFICVLLFLTLLIFLFPFSIVGTAIAADDSKIVRVGIYENQPKIFTDDEGNASGFWPDIIDYIALEEGWKIEYIPGTWTECMKRLEDNEIDIMPDVAYSEERNKTYAFSHETVLTSWSKVYTRKESGIQSIIDLNGKNIAVLKGSVNVEGPDGIKALVKLFDIDCTFTEVDSYIRVFELVENGEVDAGVTSKDFGNQHEMSFDVIGTAIVFQPSSLYFAFSKNSSSTSYFIERIDHHIKELKEDTNSIYYQSMEKWLGVKHGGNPIIPMWIIWTLIGVGALVLLFAGGSFILRSQVKSRTQALTAEIITRNRAEVELSKYRYHLEKLVEERTAELAQKNVELEQANIRLQEVDRLKSAFLATMSHELRTPLNSIIGFTGILQQGLVGPVNAEQKKQLGIVRDSSSHLLNLINDVLDISKIEAGQFTVASEPCDLRAAIEKVSRTMQPLAEKKGLALEVDVAPEVGTVISDQRRVEQIIYNLISNAIKFTENGHVRVESSLKGDEIITSVIDTGIGIKNEDIDHLFKPFHQIETGIMRKYEGTGLGLSICKKILDLLGGRIWVESEWGKGSKFSFALPVERRL